MATTRLKLIKVYSFVRSGTALMLETLGRNFYPWYADLVAEVGEWGHWKDRQLTRRNPYGLLSGNHRLWTPDMGPCIYIYRDVRDVALSVWRTKEFLNPRWRHNVKMPFERFLWTPLDWLYTPGHRCREEDKVLFEQWVDHLTFWQDRPDVFYVQFEQLVLSPIAVITQLAEFLGARYHEYRNEPVAKLVGLAPNEGGVGRWKDYFSWPENLLFYALVPEGFWGLYNA